MDIKKQLQAKIDEAWERYGELYEYEESTDFDDAMDGFDRKEAEGYAMGLEAAYHLFFGERYISAVPDPEDEGIDG